MAITTTIGSSNTSASLGDANDTRIVKVTVAGAQGIQGTAGAAGATATQLSLLADVTSTAVADGSMLIYSGSSSKWTATNSIEATSGTITVSGGNF